MYYDGHKDPRPGKSIAAIFMPPAAVEETAWDILLALHSDRSCKLGLDKLGRLASVPHPVLERWLSVLEQRQLITGTRHRFTSEMRPVLTRAGRALLDRYLSATSDLQVGAQH